MQREGGWGFGPQMLEALAAPASSGWGAWYSVSADTANADTKPEPETRPEMEQLEPAAPGWGATGATVNEGGWGFGPQMLEALAARDVGGLPSGWGAQYSVSADTANADTKPEPETRPERDVGGLPPPPPPRPAAPTNNTDELEELVPTLVELLAIKREREQRQSARDDKSIAQHNANAFVQMGATGTRVPPGVWPPRYFVNEVMAGAQTVEQARVAADPAAKRQGLPAGRGFLPPPPPPRPGAPNDNTDEDADMQPAPEIAPEAELETATHHQVRTIHTPMPPVNVLCYLLLTSGWVLIRMCRTRTTRNRRRHNARASRRSRSRRTTSHRDLLPRRQICSLLPRLHRRQSWKLPLTIRSAQFTHPCLLSMYYATCC
jgi:hypothetical protein